MYSHRREASNRRRSREMVTVTRYIDTPITRLIIPLLALENGDCPLKGTLGCNNDKNKSDCATNTKASRGRTICGSFLPESKYGTRWIRSSTLSGNNAKGLTSASSKIEKGKNGKLVTGELRSKRTQDIQLTRSNMFHRADSLLITIL